MTKLQHTVLPLPQPQEPKATVIKKSHLKGLFKLGEVVIPGYPDFPSFRETGPEKHVNRMLDYMYEDDRAAILVILSLFSVLPKFAINWLMLFIDWGSLRKGAPGAVFRMLQIALKGLIFTLYYTDNTKGKIIHGKINYDAKIVK